MKIKTVAQRVKLTHIFAYMKLGRTLLQTFY